MSNLPPLLRDQRTIDADHLRLLAIFHFIGAGLAALGLLFVFAHYTFVHAVFENPHLWENQKAAPPPREFFVLFKWFYLFFAFWFVVSAVLNVASGLCLQKRKARTFSLVVGGINCVYMPIGTVLGVFTILVLLRSAVREMYQA